MDQSGQQLSGGAGGAHHDEQLHLLEPYGSFQLHSESPLHLSPFDLRCHHSTWLPCLPLAHLACSVFRVIRCFTIELYICKIEYQESCFVIQNLNVQLALAFN